MIPNNPSILMTVNESGGMRGIHRFSHSAMATLFEIYCSDAREEYARQAAMHAFKIADQVELELSRFTEGSDISRLNALGPEMSARVGSRAMDCLQIARWVHVATDGAFDVAIGTGFSDVELVPEVHEVRLHAAGIQLDLGGIGKGYAVDLMAASLEEWDLPNALIHGGYSSVLALESPSGKSGWPLTLSVPAGHAVLEKISARMLALSGSGILKKDHILNPKTKEPIRHRQAAWVTVPRMIAGETGSASWKVPTLASPASTVADALSTAFMILGEEEIDKICSRYPGLEARILGLAESDREGSVFRHFPSPIA